MDTMRARASAAPLFSTAAATNWTPPGAARTDMSLETPVRWKRTSLDRSICVALDAVPPPGTKGGSAIEHESWVDGR